MDRRRAEEYRRGGARRTALRLSLAYAVAATAWIVASDQLVAALNLAPRATVFVSSSKGFLFVVVTAVILYVFSRRYLGRVETSEERYFRLFENATEGVTLYRVLRDDAGGLRDLVIEDVNPAQSERARATRERIVGRTMSAPGDLDEEMREYFEIVRDAALAGAPRRAEVHAAQRDTYALVSVFPFERGLWALAETDITQVRRAQEVLRAQDERIRQAYEDVLDAVTGGKLVLVTEDRIPPLLGTPLTPQVPVSDSEELCEARRTIREGVGRAFPEADPTPVLNASGEALNNVLTHAGSGSFQVFAKGDAVQVVVSDNGPGIDFRSLPRATLVPGFSTTATLGMGFTIMLQLADRVLLATHPGHTVLVLEIAMKVG